MRSEDQLRREVEEVIAPYGISFDHFRRLDIDDLPSDDLRDTWLIVSGLLGPTK